MSLVMPAIDLRAGRCVRLVQGRLDAETVYSDDPVAVARSFAAAGARRLHVVDLDGAFDGAPRNLEAVRAVAAAVDVPVQMGGGLRTLEAVARVLESGVRRVVLGTAAVENPRLVEAACRRWPGRVLVGVDARDGRVAIRGWTQGDGADAVELAKGMKKLGVEEIVFTDIAQDGMMKGPNVTALRRMVEETGLKVVASGGITTPEDAAAVASVPGVSGMIIGKALYEGKLTVAEALIAADRPRRPGRLLVCLDVRDGRVVKGVQFADVEEVGDPVPLAERYGAEGADELVVLNIGRSDREEFAALVARLRARVSTPLTAGGGVDGIDAARRLLDAGADKVSVGSAAVARPELVADLAEAFGSERVVVALDCRRRPASRRDEEEAGGSPAAGGWEVVVDGGRTPTGRDAVAWARRAESLGAGEIVLNSIDGDGTGRGYDHALNRAVTARVTAPVVASGGVGELAHLRDGFVRGGVDAVLAAGLFHFGGATVAEAKRFLQAAGVATAPGPAGAEGLGGPLERGG